MPRSARLHVPGGFYHIVLRGNHGEALFGTADDSQSSTISSPIRSTATVRAAHAFYWMSSHLHALLQIDHSPLGGSATTKISVLRIRIPDFGQELWSTDGMRLTVLLDPGKMKRGVEAPRSEQSMTGAYLIPT